MRKISFIMAALALVLGVTQCKKENKPLASGETQRIVLTASNGNDGSKVVVNETPKMLNLTWQDTDKIAASGAVEGTLAFKSDVELGTATFEGPVTRKEGDEVTFSYGQKEVLSTVFSEQTGDVAWIQGHLYLESDAVHYNDKGVYGQDEIVEMKLQYAVLKLDLSALGTETGNPVTITGGTETVSVENVTDEVGKVYYVAMPAAGSTTYTFSGNDKSVKKTWTLAANIFYTANAEGAAIVIKPKTKPADALSGVFTVSDSGTPGDASDDVKVYFSKGNLYAKKDNGTWSWHFYDNQYGCNSLNTGSSRTAQDTDSEIDLFTWGYDAAKSIIPNGTGFVEGYNTLPSDYEPFSKTEDWGYVFGGESSEWRTLTCLEWLYLLNHHSKKWVLVNGVNGYVIAPDGFSGNLAASYSDNAALAADNLVFFPATGMREGSTVSVVGEYGRYWSSSAFSLGKDNAYFLNFSSDFVSVDRITRNIGWSVRLVTNVE